MRQYMADVKQNSKSLRSFSKKARDTGTKNLLLSGVSGIGMGVLGIGLPDIPVFTGMILRIFMRLLCSMDTAMKAGKKNILSYY